MKRLRNIKLGAIAVIANGMAVLMMATPAQAFACAPFESCSPETPAINCANQAFINAWCNAHTPPGCSYVSGYCVQNGQCPGGGPAFHCNYQ